MIGDTVVVFAGGDPPGPAAVAGLVATDVLVVAADSGADHALHLGWPVHVLVGDLDSVSSKSLRELERRGAEIFRHPVDKDQTDLALALDVAQIRVPRCRLVVIGGGGGRLDHLIANQLLLASEDYASCQVEARMGTARVTVIRGRRQLHGKPNDLISLLAVAGTARGVSTDGLQFPLIDADLAVSSSLGVSNRFLGSDAAVTVGAGVVLAVQPGQ